MCEDHANKLPFRHEANRRETQVIQETKIIRHSRKILSHSATNVFKDLTE